MLAVLFIAFCVLVLGFILGRSFEASRLERDRRLLRHDRDVARIQTERVLERARRYGIDLSEHPR